MLNEDEQDYVDELIFRLDPVPIRRVHICALNLAGPEQPKLSPPQLADAVQLRRRIDAGEWVVDLREHRAFAAGHVAGSVNVELDEQLATYLGWLVPWNASITLLAATEGEVDRARRELVRIGIERPVAAATGCAHDWAGLEPLVGYPRATFHDLANALAGPNPPTVLDVRLPSELTGSHVRGSLHVPVPEVLDRIDQIPERSLWVLGRGREHGVIAALLHAHGRDVTAVDDDFANAASAGVPLISRACAPSAA